MKNDILKIPDFKGMHSHYYCPKCHFCFLADIELRGANYCPNCGQQLKWSSKKMINNFKKWVETSKRHYNFMKGKFNEKRFS